MDKIFLGKCRLNLVLINVNFLFSLSFNFQNTFMVAVFVLCISTVVLVVFQDFGQEVYISSQIRLFFLL